MELKRIREDKLHAFEGTLPPGIVREIAAGETELICAIDGEGESRAAAGVMAVSFSGDTAQIAWFCVAEEFRGRGIANRMLADFLLSASDGGVVRRVCASIPFTEENAPLLQLFSRFGFERGSGDFHRYEFTLSQLDPGLLSGAQLDSIPLKDLTDYQIRELSNHLRAERANIVPLPFCRKTYNCELSRACLKSGGISSIVLIRDVEEDRLELSFIYSIDRGGLEISSLLSAPFIGHMNCIRLKRL